MFIHGLKIAAARPRALALAGARQDFLKWRDGVMGSRENDYEPGKENEESQRTGSQTVMSVSPRLPHA